MKEEHVSILKKETCPNTALEEIEPFPSIEDAVLNKDPPKSDAQQPSIEGGMPGPECPNRNIKERDRSPCAGLRGDIQEEQKSIRTQPTCSQALYPCALPYPELQGVPEE